MARRALHKGKAYPGEHDAIIDADLHYLLANPTYTGRIRHKEKTWPGLHPPIIAQKQWERVQALLQQAATRPRRQRAEPESADTSGGPGGTVTERPVLLGKFRDETGDRLTPSHTIRRGKRLRYYVSRRLLQGQKDPTGWRLPAPALEAAVIRALADHLQDRAACHGLLAAPDATTAEVTQAAAAVLVGKLKSNDREALSAILLSGAVSRDTLTLQLDTSGLAAALAVEEAQLDPALLEVKTPFTRRRRGVETRLIAGRHVAAPDPTLCRILGKANRWCEELRHGLQLADIARREGHSESYLRTRAQLAFLAPGIQAAILAGTLPPELSIKEILRRGVPLDWAEQERRLGLVD